MVDARRPVDLSAPVYSAPVLFRLISKMQNGVRQPFRRRSPETGVGRSSEVLLRSRIEKFDESTSSYFSATCVGRPAPGDTRVFPRNLLTKKSRRAFHIRPKLISLHQVPTRSRTSSVTHSSSVFIRRCTISLTFGIYFISSAAFVCILASQNTQK